MKEIKQTWINETDGAGSWSHYFGEHAQERPHLKKLHLNSKLNDAKEATRQSTGNRKHYNAQCESFGNRKKTSEVRAQGGTRWDDVRIISGGSKLENFVKKLNFILDAIKILCKVINLERDRIWLLLKRSLWLLWKMDWKKAIQNQGSHCRNPGEMIIAWAEGVAGAQEGRKRIWDVSYGNGFDIEVRERNLRWHSIFILITHRTVMPFNR